MGEEIKEEVEEKLIRERGEEVISFLSNKKFLFVLLGLIILLILAWHTRTVNVPNLKDVTTGGYTLGPDLDPFLFLRYAKYIVENGKLMEQDYMRYVPLGYPVTKGVGKIVLPYMIAYFHKLLSLFSDVSVEYSAVMFPAFMFLLTVFVFFLLIRKVFEDDKHRSIIALIATVFLIVSPSLLPRTVAGIPEKESVGFLFMFLAFYFFLLAWKTKTLKKSLILASLAGLFTVLMGLIWGGWIYIFVIIALFALVEFVLGKINKRKKIVYSTWILLSIFLSWVLPGGTTLMGMIASTSSGLASVVFSLILIDTLIFKTRIKDMGFIKKLREKVPDRLISIIFIIIFVIVASSLVFGVSFIPNSISHVYSLLIQPSETRLDFTVAENRQPYFNGWADSFGPVVRGIPLLFWLFFIGSIFLFYQCIEKMERKVKISLTLSYIIFLFALIFSRYSAGSLMNGTNTASKAVYFGGFLVLIASSGYWLYNYHKEKELDKLKQINSSYLFLLAFFFISLVGARGAIRLTMVLSVPTAGIVSYFAVSMISKIREHKDGTLKLIVICIAVTVSCALLYSFYFNYTLTVAQARAMVPSTYTQQWQKAMGWVRENTPENAVFSHWWDYGYWIQTIGKRATILDGGNSISYWNHLLGRHVLTGQSEREALEFLYAHNATYLLIDSTEIGKYGAYSSIGSDENYDRYSQISTFSKDEKNVQELKNETVYIYTGNMFVDEDYLWQGEDKQEFFPAYKAGIGGVILRISKNNELKQPTVVFVYQGKQFNIPMRYIYYQDRIYDFQTGYGGGLYIIPRLVSSGGGVLVKDMEEGLFLTEKTMRALWVKLYLFNEGENFELVYKEDNFIVGELKKQNIDVKDFVLYGGLQGPIKIWKVNYPKDIKFKEEYLSIEYPDEIRLAKPNFYN